MVRGTDTIVARATASGEGAIGIIRISGPLTFSIIEKCFKSAVRRSWKYNYLTYGHLIDPEEGSVIDDIFCVVFKKPHSYTGEDAGEFHCHGGPAIISQALFMLCHSGARMAEPGEFTKRAFLNGKMDLTRAEAVCDLIRSQTDKASRIALRQLQGGLDSKIKHVKEKIITIAAEIEARLDFPEQDLEVRDNSLILNTFESSLSEIQSLISQGIRARVYTQGLRVVLLGKPNTGKSSLFNALLKMERSIVTPHPGTTRDTIESTVDLLGCPISYVDTAGIQKTGSEVEMLGIERAKKEISKADLNIFLVDSSSPLDHEDHHIYELLSENSYILVLNKIDLPVGINENELLPFEKKAAAKVMTSAITGAGIDALESIISQILITREITTEDALVTNERHLALLRECSESLAHARKEFLRGTPEEFLMVDIRESLHALSGITGEEVNEEILDAIFKRFCIGK